MYCPLDVEDFFDHDCVYVVRPDLRRRWAERSLPCHRVSLDRTTSTPTSMANGPSLVAEMLCKCAEVRKTYASLRDMSFLGFDFVFPVKIPQVLSVPRRVARNCNVLEKKRDNVTCLESNLHCQVLLLNCLFLEGASCELPCLNVASFCATCVARESMALFGLHPVLSL